MDTKIKEYLAEIGSKGGKARAKLSKKELSRIGKLGGRPRNKAKKRLDKRLSTPRSSK